MSKLILIEEKLANFLIDEDAMSKYIENVTDIRQALAQIGAMVNDKLTEDRLDCAFPWLTTAEGHKYWSDLSIKFNLAQL